MQVWIRIAAVGACRTNDDLIKRRRRRKREERRKVPMGIIATFRFNTGRLSGHSLADDNPRLGVVSEPETQQKFCSS